MRHLRLSLLAFVIGFPVLSHAAAFQLFELGAPTIGTAGVGQAVVNDASSAYFNPAAMGFLPGTELMLGAQMTLPYTNFSANTTTTISGDNGGLATMLTPGMGTFFSYNFAPCLKFGVSVTSPYGGSLNYDDGWAGRYIVQDALFYTININPSMAYRFNRWFAMGIGAVVEYMNLQQTTALRLSEAIDGQIDVKVDNFAPGFNIGLMFEPVPSTRIGIAYRSAVHHNLHGDLTFLRAPIQPNVTTKMTMPQNVIASLAQDIGCRFTLLGELGWANWASTKNTTLRVGDLSAVTALNWNNTYRVGLGGQFKVTPNLLLQAGAAFDSSPTNTANRTPVLPMDRQYRFGAGAMYRMIKPVTFGVSYEYWNMGRARINNVSEIGVLSGQYTRNYANVFQASLNVEV